MYGRGGRCWAITARLLVYVRLDDTGLVNPDLDIQDVDTPCYLVVLKGELDGGIECVAMDHELLQLLLGSIPDKENNNYKPSPQVDSGADPGCQHLRLQPPHEHAGEGGRHPSPHAGAKDMQPEGGIKHQEVHGQDKHQEGHREVSGQLFIHPALL